ncbi:MAG: hypothetical protein R3316_03590 [Rhodovibrionaceae bacterium]|nr:hypothetical protein [Rhodovibrionaceae bacterium]
MHKPLLALFSGLLFLLSACASKPPTPPTVIDATLSRDVLAPGESFNVSFTLDTVAPEQVERVFVRGLPANTLAAGTQIDLARPQTRSTPYDTQIGVLAPAADGTYNLELVVATEDRNYVVPLGQMSISDLPSRFAYAQLTPGSHKAARCQLNTRLVKLEYAIIDGNGATDFTAPVMIPSSPEARDLIFFPRFEQIAWAEGEQGIVLQRPKNPNVIEELVTTDIRVNCRMRPGSSYEFMLMGQNISRLNGRTTRVKSDTFRYFVE